MTIEIVDFPIENGGSFHSYVKLSALYSFVSLFSHGEASRKQMNFKSVEGNGTNGTDCATFFFLNEAHMQQSIRMGCNICCNGQESPLSIHVNPCQSMSISSELRLFLRHIALVLHVGVVLRRLGQRRWLGRLQAVFAAWVLGWCQQLSGVLRQRCAISSAISSLRGRSMVLFLNIVATYESWHCKHHRAQSITERFLNGHSFLHHFRLFTVSVYDHFCDNFYDNFIDKIWSVTFSLQVAMAQTYHTCPDDPKSPKSRISEGFPMEISHEKPDEFPMKTRSERFNKRSQKKGRYCGFLDFLDWISISLVWKVWNLSLVCLVLICSDCQSFLVSEVMMIASLKWQFLRQHVVKIC